MLNSKQKTKIQMLLNIVALALIIGSFFQKDIEKIFESKEIVQSTKANEGSLVRSDLDKIYNQMPFADFTIYGKSTANPSPITTTEVKRESTKTNLKHSAPLSRDTTITVSVDTTLKNSVDTLSRANVDSMKVDTIMTVDDAMVSIKGVITESGFVSNAAMGEFVNRMTITIEEFNRIVNEAYDSGYDSCRENSTKDTTLQKGSNVLPNENAPEERDMPAMTSSNTTSD